VGRRNPEDAECQRDSGDPEPVFQEEQGFSVTFRKDVFNPDSLSLMGLNPRQIQTVEYIRAKGKITNSEFQTLASIRKRQATTDLTDLEQRKIISRVGTTGKGTHYILKGAPCPAVIYATHPNGLDVMTDSTRAPNVATSAIGSASLRIALFTFALCTKSAIVVVAPWFLRTARSVLRGIF
jgi:hypothetical protein